MGLNNIIRQLGILNIYFLLANFTRHHMDGQASFVLHISPFILVLHWSRIACSKLFFDICEVDRYEHRGVSQGEKKTKVDLIGSSEDIIA